MQKEFDVSVEVVDPRTIKPLDIDTIVKSVKKTNRLVIAEESHSFASVGAEISHQVMENAFDYLGRARSNEFLTAEAPMPYAKNLEELALPRRSENRRGSEGSLLFMIQRRFTLIFVFFIFIFGQMFLLNE